MTDRQVDRVAVRVTPPGRATGVGRAPVAQAAGSNTAAPTVMISEKCAEFVLPGA